MRTPELPLTVWTCDTCGEPITSVADGYVEWLQDSEGARAFRLVHHASASPRRASDPEGCYEHGRAHGRNDLPLRDFLNAPGIARLLGILEEGVADLPLFLDLFRRVQVPRYEEARPLLADARQTGDLDEYGDYAYFPDVLRAFVQRGRV